MKKKAQDETGFESWLTYQKTEIILQATKYFCQRFYHKCEPESKHMNLAVCSAFNHIMEAGYEGHSGTMKAKILRYAEEELEILRSFYKEFLVVRGFQRWSLYHPEIIKYRRRGRLPGANYKTFRWYIENPSPEVSANFILNMIRTTIFLLKKQSEAAGKRKKKTGIATEESL